MTDCTIEDVLKPERHPGEGGFSSLRMKSATEQMRALHAATADGPVFSADGTLAVIRADPDLAKRLGWLASAMEDPHNFRAQSFDPVDVRRAAALLAAPAPADPEGGRVVSGHCEIAECMDCRPRLPQPFRDGDTAGRDTWAKAHSNGTGHTVITYHEPFEVVFGGTGIGVVTPIERGDFDE